MKDRIIIQGNCLSSLFASRGDVRGERAEIAIANTRAHISGVGEIEWLIDAAAGEYRVAVNAACTGSVAIRFETELGAIEASLSKTHGPFFQEDENFERIEIEGSLSLPAGASRLTAHVDAGEETLKLSSIELIPAALTDSLEAQAREAEAQRASIARYTDGYGFMFHWTAQSMPERGPIADYETAVNAFDVEAFADQVRSAGGKYVFLTANHAVSHFPAPLPEWEAYYPGSTTRRDLVAELSRALSARGIDLMLYLNFSAAYFQSVRSRVAPAKDGVIESLALSQSLCDDYVEVALTLLRAIGERYGRMIHGYWVDSCYQTYQHFVDMDYKPFYQAAKVGNPDRLVCFNFWVLPVTTPWQDFWAGETGSYIKPPSTANFEFGCAKGHRPHALLIMEDNWWHGVQDSPISPPKFHADQLAEFIRGMNGAGGMVTLNLEVYQDGRIGPATMKLLHEVQGLLAAK